MRPVVVFNPHAWRAADGRRARVHWTREAGASRRRRRGARAVPMQLTRPLDDYERAAQPLRLSGRRAAARLPHLPGSARESQVASARALCDRRLRSRTSTCLLELDAADRPDRATRAQGERGRPRARPGEARCRDRRSAATRGATASPPTTASSASSSALVRGCWSTGPCAASSASRAATAPRRCARTTSSRPTRPYVDVRVAIDWREPMKLLKLRYPTSVETDRATFETPYGHLQRPGGRRRGAGAVVGRRLRRRPRAGRDQRREVRLRRARRRHRDQRGAQPRLGVARPARARAGRRLRVHGPGPADLPRPPRPARRRLARGGCRPPRRGAEPARLCADRDLPRRPLPQRATLAADAGRRCRRHGAEGRRGAAATQSCASTSGGRGRASAIAAPSSAATIEADFAAHEIKTFVRARDGERSPRRTCSSGDRARRRRLAAAGLARATSGAGTSNKPWDAPGWLPRGCPAACSTISCARARCAISASSALAGSPNGCRSGRGSIGARVDRAGPDPFRGRRPWGDGLRRRRGESHPRGRLHAIRGRASAAGEHLLAVAVTRRPPSEPQVGVTRRVKIHKSRMGYGWDFCPRLCIRGSGGRSTLDAPPELFPMVALRTARHGRDRGRRRAARRLARALVAERDGRAAALRRRGASSVGFREVSFDDYELRGQRRRASPVRGWNWVPIDALYGVPRPEKLAHLLAAPPRANVNLLRVWGGGLIETPEFYELCDRLGLLVWQEFSPVELRNRERSPRDDPGVRRNDGRRRAARSCRAGAAHPSLAIWCGGNELDGDDSTPVLAALREVVPSSTQTATGCRRRRIGEADVHGPWEHQGLGAHTEHYDTRTSKLHSEFGVEGMTNRRALEALIDRGAPLAGRPLRTPSTSTSAHGGTTRRSSRRSFGGRIEDVETMRRCSQWLQYEGLRYAVEATLRRGAGTIPWQLNEPYPNAWCTWAVDHRGDPKPAYWGVARAYGGAPDRPVRDGSVGRAGRGACDGDSAGAFRRPRRAASSRRRSRESSLRRSTRSPHDVFLLDLGGATGT